MATEEGEGAGRAPDVVKTVELETPTLETERFTMRKLVQEDAAALLPTLSSEEHCRYLLREAFRDEEELGHWLCDPEWDGRSWAAIDRNSGDLVARIVAVPVSEAVVELGYITVQDRQGEGIAMECSERLLEQLFEVEKHHRVTAGTDPRNRGSNRVLEKLGFRREAHCIESIKTHIGWCDEYHWGLLASEWQDRRAGS